MKRQLVRVMDTIIETALLQAEAKGKVAFQSAGLKIKKK